MASRAARPVQLDISPTGGSQDGQAEQEQCPVLLLGLFARTPFLSFGTVRPGSSRTALLGIENPNAQQVEVQVEQVPEKKGFSLEQRQILVQPLEKVFVSIRWTPLQEGGVRELLTFVTNGIVKHRVILLGKAELPTKKKRSLWESIKKRSISTPTHSVRQKKRDFNIKTVNKTVCVSEKRNYGGTERVRSLLQSCENFELAAGNKSPPRISKENIDSQNNVPSLRFVRKETRDVTEGSLRCSSTYSVVSADMLCAPLQEVAGAPSIDKAYRLLEESASETELENGSCISPVSSVAAECPNTVCTPNYMRRSNAFSVLAASGYQESYRIATSSAIVKDDFNFNANKTLSPQAFLNELLSERSVRTTPETRLLNRTCSQLTPTPDTQTSFFNPVTQRRFLSPDSFVNDSYEPDEDVESLRTTILSPDQFLKDNLSTIGTSSSNQEYNPMLLSSESSASNLADLSPLSSSPIKCFPSIEEHNEVLPLASESVEHESGNVILEGLEPVPSRLTFFVKPKESVAVETAHQKRAQINSQTVIKSKPNLGVTKSKCNTPPRARRCLKSAEIEVHSDLLRPTKAVQFQDLPVIDLASCKLSVQGLCCKSIDSCILPVAGRKRKSGEHLEHVKVATKEYAESVQTGKAIAPSPKVKKGNGKGAPLSRGKINEEPPKQRKRAASLALKSSSMKTQTVADSKTSFTFRKSLQLDLQSKKSTPILKNEKRVVAVPQSQLTFINPVKTAIPRHPMPFAAKNMFYDERWKEKQERGFTWWLNFILTPDDLKTESLRVNAAAILLGAENHHKASVPKAPSKEEMSLKAYTARCRLNRLRRAACRLFTSDSVVKAIRRLEIEIEAKRLLVRKDRHLWKDVGERQKVLNWLLSYNTLWLRIGLETVFGELISLESNSDVMGLALFILNRLLWNPDIGAEYRHPTVPHLYRDGHEEALSKFTLKKLLLLVFFLDHSKQSRLIDHDPCLFCKDSDFKSSKDVLLAISRDFLSGEGDLSRHLGYLGLPVSHVQTPLDEFEFAVINIAVDLQCGVRLVRAMELLTQNWTLSKKLRVPAISRLQKMHNVEVALSVLKERNIPLKDEHGTAIDSRDIVDRHRERTLALLWRIVSAFQVDVLLNVEEVKEEIAFLKQTCKLQKQLGALKQFQNLPDVKRASSGNFSSLKYSKSVGLLMEWVNATCAFYNTKVENFTVPFSDGRVLCYLVHHYHPSYVPFSDICQHTSQTVECTQTGSIALNSSESETSMDTWPIIFEDPWTTSVKYKELLENERKNFNLLNTAVSNLGGIPAMINHSDMSNTIPDEKVIITYLSFLCARLLDLRKETRAARVIQSAWRKYKLKAELERFQARDEAARKIQAAVKTFLRRWRFKKMVSAVVVLQKNWKRYLAQKEAQRLRHEKLKLSQCHAATVIQAFWRSFSARRYYLQLQYSTVRIQARIRTKVALRSYKQQLGAALLIQRAYHAWKLAVVERQRYKTLKSSSLVIQAAFRRWKRRKLLKQTVAAVVLQAAFRKWQTKKAGKMEKAAVVVQSWYRMYAKRRGYLQLKENAIKIQAWFRCIKARHAYESMKKSIIMLQKYYRAYRQGQTEKEKYLQKRSAVLSLQTAFRKMKACQYCKKIRAARLLQSFWRMRQERINFLQVKRSVILLQSHVRKWQQQKRYKKCKDAAIVIQTQYRGLICTRNMVLVFQSKRSAAVTIQKYYRACVTRKNFQKIKTAVSRIQAVVKMRQAQHRYIALKKAALFVQRRYRSKKCILKHKEEYRRKRESCILLQACVRGHQTRKRMQLWKKSAAILQAQYRMQLERRRYLNIRSAVNVIQNRFVAYKAKVDQRQRFLKIQKSVICIQAAYKGYQARKALKLQTRAAVKIQAVFRTYSAQKAYQSILKACVTIQRYFRALKTGKRVRLHFIQRREAAVCIQGAYRGWVVRRQIRKQHFAAVLLQSSFRTMLAERQFRQMKKAALTIQQHYRARSALKRTKQQYFVLRSSVIKLQAAWRGTMVRNQLQRMRQAATIIQSNYRMYSNKTHFQTMRQAAIVIQNHFQAYSARKKQRSLYLKMKSAAVLLQAAWRGRNARKQVDKLNEAARTIQATYKSFLYRRKYAELRAATVTIQRWYRRTGHANTLRRAYLQLRSATITLQAASRGLRARRRMQLFHHAATSIQASYRMHQLHMSYSKVKVATLVIQRRYRASVKCRQAHSNYLELKRATITLQAACRGAAVRQELQHMHKAAIRIQACFRMYRQRRYYKRLVTATKSMQLLHRACSARNVQTHKYHTLKKAALCIQSTYRGMQTRRCLQVRHAAAIVIQRRFKSYLERERFLRLKEASILIQQRYRMKKLGNLHRRELICLREAAVTLQAVFRGWRVRRDMKMRARAAIRIQTAFRRHKVYVHYQAVKLASIKIQQHYRAYRLTNLERTNFLNLHHSVLVLQSAFRGMRARQHLKGMHRAATLIQANYRMCIYRRSYRRIQWATRVIQERVHANRQRNIEFDRYSKIMKAVCLVQAVFRGLRVRKKVWKMRTAATTIQRCFKGLVERRSFLRLKDACVLIQRRYRELVMARHQRQQYLSLRKSATFLQAAYRGAKVRRTVRELHQAATTIQSAFRMRRAFVLYQSMKTSANIIQKFYREHVELRKQRNNYLTLKKSVVVIQAAYRGMKERRNRKEMHAAATIIQFHYRCHRQYVHYKRTCWAVATFQQRYRAKCLRDVQMKKYVQLRKAAVLIQATFRGMKVRQQLQKLHQAATVIQKNFKMYSCQRKYLALRTSAIVCQRRCRASLMGKRLHQDFVCLRKAAVCIQVAYRGFKVRKVLQQKNLAATKIQSIFRMHCVRTQYQTSKSACCLIQAFYRSYIKRKHEREKYLTICKSVVLIQAAYRGMKERQNLKIRHESAKRIQSQYRMYRQRMLYRRMCWAVRVIKHRYRANKTRDLEQHYYRMSKKAILCIQTAFRSMKARHLIKQMQAARCIQSILKMYVARKRFVEKKMASVVIQSAFKGYLARTRYKQMLDSVTRIQIWYRACRLGRLQKGEYSLLRKSAVIVQSAFRGLRARKLLKEKRAARTIQACLHMIVHRRKFIRFRNAALVIQAHFRMYKAQKQYKRLQKATLVLQSHYRSRLAMKRQQENFFCARRNVITVQSLIRRFIQQKRLEKMKASAIKLQLIQQKQEQRLLRFTAAAYHHLCALKIQRMYKVHLLLKHAKAQINSVVFLQRSFRTRLQHKKYLEDRQKIVHLQRSVRTWLDRRKLSACVIQRMARRFLLQKRKEKIMNGIIKFQALWRGYFWRRRHDTKKILNLRKRLVEVNTACKEENKLCNRTSIAIYYLLKYKDLSYILAALKHLEVATRLSSVCCENMADSGAIVNIFILIRSCNRSIPCMEVIRYSIQVLLNLAKHEKTTKAVYDVENSVDTLTELMQTYREKAGDKVADKGGSIFTKTCCLLAILSLDTKRALEIRAAPKVVDRICSLFKLTARKHKMDAQRANFLRKMNNPVSETFRRNGVMQPTPMRTRVVSSAHAASWPLQSTVHGERKEQVTNRRHAQSDIVNQRYPLDRGYHPLAAQNRIKPDWNLRKDAMKEIEDPLAALQMVMETLSITL